MTRINTDNSQEKKAEDNQIADLNVEHNKLRAVKTVSLGRPMLFSIDEALNIPRGYVFTDEAVQLMAGFDGRSKKMDTPGDL